MLEKISLEVGIRPVEGRDGPVLMAANRENRGFHAPWAAPFVDGAGFAAWFEATATGRRAAFVVLERGEIAGVVNLNEIVRGVFQSAYLGYYGYAWAAGRGVMGEGVRLVVAEAFGAMGLHRVEANIQPGNVRSRALVRRLGFRMEGFSPGYLYLDGAWRDHERWALVRGVQTAD